jgi:hypothetical protein
MTQRTRAPAAASYRLAYGCPVLSVPLSTVRAKTSQLRFKTTHSPSTQRNHGKESVVLLEKQHRLIMMCSFAHHMRLGLLTPERTGACMIILITVHVNPIHIIRSRGWREWDWGICVILPHATHRAALMMTLPINNFSTGQNTNKNFNHF